MQSITDHQQIGHPHLLTVLGNDYVHNQEGHQAREANLKIITAFDDKKWTRAKNFEPFDGHKDAFALTK